MKNIKENKFYVIIFLIFSCLACKEKINNSVLGKIIPGINENVVEGIDSRLIGAWRFSCKKITAENNTKNEDFSILFKIEHVEKPIHPFLFISNSEEQANSQSEAFFKEIESKCRLAFDDKSETAEICIDRNPDKSKPFIDLLVVFKNPTFKYSKVEFSYEDNTFDIGKVIIPLSTSNI